MKIKRNDPCSCGSGKKYKRCCANKHTAKPASSTQNAPQKQEKITLGKAIKDFQELAAQKKQVVQQTGVFLFFADEKGDAWLLELTDADCIQIASSGSPVEISLQEDDETIVVDWTHKYSFKNKSLQVKSYKGKQIKVLRDAPSQKLFAVRRKFLKRISPDLLDQIHLDK